MSAWPAELPTEDAVISPVLRFIAGTFTISRKRSGAKATYDGIDPAIETCDDGNRLFDEEHLASRKAQGLPFWGSLFELAFLVVFRLGRQYERRAAGPKRTAQVVVGGNRRQRRQPVEHIVAAGRRWG